MDWETCEKFSWETMEKVWIGQAFDEAACASMVVYKHGSGKPRTVCTAQ